MNVTFPHIGCAIISLDAMDVSGDAHLDVIHNIYKARTLTPAPLQWDG